MKVETSEKIRDRSKHMKQSKFTETQIVNILKEAESGVALDELSRKHGFSKSAFYKWKSKYSGMDASALKQLKEIVEKKL
jgi:putative transposase